MTALVPDGARVIATLDNGHTITASPVDNVVYVTSPGRLGKIQIRYADGRVSP